MHVLFISICLGCLFHQISTFIYLDIGPVSCGIPCEHGKCVTVNFMSKACVCEDGYKGLTCHIATCVLEKCNDRGVCTETMFGTQCKCNYQYMGLHCEYPAPHMPWFGGVRTTSTTLPAVTSKESMSVSTSSSVAPTTTSSITTTQYLVTATSMKLSTSTEVNRVTCSGSELARSIAKMRVHTNNDTCTCLSGSCASPEAFVLDLCIGLTSSPSSWKPGTNVMQSCDTLPLYSPVAVFSNGIHTSDDIIGILVGCTDDGFMIATQTCDRSPTIQTITKSQDGSSGNVDSHTFYTIEA